VIRWVPIAGPKSIVVDPTSAATRRILATLAVTDAGAAR
jgi:hypothetical protein